MTPIFTRPSQLNAYRIERELERDVRAERHAWRLFVALQVGCYSACAAAFVVWAVLTFGPVASSPEAPLAPAYHVL